MDMKQRSQPKTTGTVLKPNKTLLRHHICLCQLRGRSRSVHLVSIPKITEKFKKNNINYHALSKYLDKM